MAETDPQARAVARHARKHLTASLRALAAALLGPGAPPVEVRFLWPVAEDPHPETGAFRPPEAGEARCVALTLDAGEDLSLALASEPEEPGTPDGLDRAFNTLLVALIQTLADDLANGGEEGEEAEAEEGTGGGGGEGLGGFKGALAVPSWGPRRGSA